MIQDSLQSSDHILAVQSPTDKKFFTNVGLRSTLITGPYCALNRTASFSAGVLPFLFPDITVPISIKTSQLHFNRMNLLKNSIGKEYIYHFPSHT